MHIPWEARLLLLALVVACDGTPVSGPPAQFAMEASCVDNPDYTVSTQPALAAVVGSAPAGSVIAIDGMIALRNAVIVQTRDLTFTCATPGSGLEVMPGFSPPMLMFVNAAGVRFHDLVLDARGATAGALQALNNGIGAFATNVTLENNEVFCGPQQCVFFIGAAGSVIRGNTFTAAGGVTGVHVQGSGPLRPRLTIRTDRTRIENNTIITAGASTDARFAGIRVRDGDGLYVARNIIRGPWLNGIATAELSNSRFEHNDIAGTKLYGVRAATNPLAFPSDVSNTFLANKFSAVGDAAFRIASACGNGFVGNIVTKKDANYAAIFDASSGGNVFVGAGGHGAIDNGAADCDADGNTDENRLSGQGKVLKGVSIGSIMQSSKNAGELN